MRQFIGGLPGVSVFQLQLPKGMSQARLGFDGFTAAKGGARNTA